MNGGGAGFHDSADSLGLASMVSYAADTPWAHEVCPDEEGTYQGLVPESQGQNLVLTVFYVP